MAPVDNYTSTVEGAYGAERDRALSTGDYDEPDYPSDYEDLEWPL